MVNGTELARGFNEHLPVGAQLSGGLAGDGTRFERTLVVACQPQALPDPDSDEIAAALSAPVHAAVDEAVTVVRELVDQLLEETTKGGIR